MGRHLGIDFSWIMVDFGSEVGRGNRSQDRPKKASKNDAKKKSNEIAKKVAIRISNPARNPGSWVLGRSPPKGRVNPSTPARKRSPATLFHTFPFHSFPFPSLRFPCLGLSWPVLACLGWIFPPNLAPKIHQNPLKTDPKMSSHLDSIF